MSEPSGAAERANQETALWSPVSVLAWTGERVGIALPPGWTALRLTAPDLVQQVERLVAEHVPAQAAPTLRAELNQEWQRLARVSAAAGAVLFGFGGAVDADTDQVVTASVLLAPQHLYQAADEGPVGPEHAMTLPAGPTVCRPRLGRAPTPVGDLVELGIEYVVTPPASPAWSLVFRTPALHHVEELVVVFDAIAGTLRFSAAGDKDHSPQADPDGPAFS